MANLRTNNLSGEQGQNAYRGSLYFNGIESADFLTLASSSDFDFSTGDVTVEAWVFMSTHPSHSHIFSTSNFDLKVSSGQIRLFTSSGETDTSRTVSTGSWHHIAAVRGASINSGNWKVYLNGIGVNYSLGSVTSGDSVAEVSGRVRTDNEEFHGFISNLRVVNGTAVYTSDFTPPTSELTLIPNTVLLCCQDTDNPLREATGKTITGFGRYADSSVELVPNGGPTTDVTGWTAYNSSVAYDTGQIKVTRSGGTGFSAYATITNAVIGQRYRASAQVRSPSSRCDLYVTTAVASGTLLQIFGTAGATVDLSGEFTATATTLYVFAAIDNDGDIGFYNRVSVKAADQGILQKFTPPYGVDAGNTFGGPIQQSSQGYMYFPTGRTEERGRGRALLFVGYNPVAAGTVVSTVDFFSIQSQGNSTTFGSLSDTFTVGAAFASSTRGIYMGGSKPAVGNVSNIDFFTIATTGNATDFGDVGTTFRYGAGLSNATRGIKAGGYQGGGSSGNLNIIEFVTIANTGNASDFGDTSSPTHGLGGLASPTRGVLGGGYPYPAASNIIEFITISTTGNTTDFGDLTEAKQLVAAGASNTRGIFGGGDNSGASKVINFITIASTGDAQDFGDLSVISEYAGMEMASNSSRMVFAGAGDYPAGSNTMEFINIATTGNASDFGDQTGDYGSSACSDSHGGLS